MGRCVGPILAHTRTSPLHTATFLIVKWAGVLTCEPYLCRRGDIAVRPGGFGGRLSPVYFPANLAL
jgi:hypothetical protein